MSALPKRFYKLAAVTGDAAPFGIALDGKAIRTPLKAALSLPTHSLAEAIAAEWNAQGEKVDPFSMPLTRLANTAIDRVAAFEAHIVAEIVKMAEHDLICYRADVPEALRERQAAAWDPIIDWAMEQLDASFVVTTGVVHVDQPPETLAAFARHVERQSAWILTALHNMATLTGSALIAAHCAQSPAEAPDDWLRAHVDEDWQVENWGQDAEALQRRQHRWAEFAACARLIELTL